MLPSAPARFSPARISRARLVAAIAGTSVVAAGTVVLALPSGVGAATNVSQATGTYLSGSVLSLNLDTLAQVKGASASNVGTPATVTDAHPLDVTALSAINLPLGGGLQLLSGLNPLLDLGAVNQFAQAKNDGSSYGASGTVTDQGAIAVGSAPAGPQGATTINLGTLTNAAGLSSVLSTTKLTIGAIAATATQAAPGTSPAPTGAYRIAGVKLDVTSPLVQNVVGQVPGLSTLVGTVCTSGCDIKATAPGLVIDLTTGVVNVDVSALLPQLDGAMPANSSLLTALGGALQNALQNLTLSVNGTPVPLGLLTTPLTNTLATVLTQLSNGISQLATITVNVQNPTPPAAGAKFTETALQVDVLPASPLALLNLASASVGPNAGPVAPAASSLNPNMGPTSGGQTVTITGANFVPGQTTVTIGGVTVPATVSPSATSLTFITPAHTAGAVHVVVNTPGGASAPLSYTYVAPATVSSINPNQGPASGGQTVTVTGTHFVPGKTSVTIGGTTIPASSVKVAADGTSLTFTTPAHSVGVVSVRVNTPAGPSGSLSYTYVPDAPKITSPANGSTTGSKPTISGTGTPGDTVTVTDGGTTICTAKVSATGHWSCTPSMPLTNGSHTITATQTAPGGETSGPSAPVNFTSSDESATSLPANSGSGNGSGAGAGNGSSSATNGGLSGALSSTGANPAGALVAAAFALLVGVGSVAAARRRRTNG